MTQMDVLYRYGTPPTLASTSAISRLREIYGVRKLEFNEAQKTVRIEYDASRLTEAVIHQLLRRAGLDIVEEVPLIAVPVAPLLPDPGATTDQPAK